MVVTIRNSDIKIEAIVIYNYPLCYSIIITISKYLFDLRITSQRDIRILWTLKMFFSSYPSNWVPTEFSSNFPPFIFILLTIPRELGEMIYRGHVKSNARTLSYTYTYSRYNDSRARRIFSRLSPRVSTVRCRKPKKSAII